LSAEPQMGKTGVFLQLGYDLWKLVGRPEHTSPESRNFLLVEADDDEIVIIRQNEEREYLEYLLTDDNIDIFVMDGSTLHTVGAARWTAKKLAEIITEKGCWSKFCLVMDDDILYWRAVTLINDPHRPFEDVEASDERSQRTDISLLRVMEYCSKENIKKHDLHKFSIIGFSVGGHKGDNRLRLAFGRQHVFAATFLNIDKLSRVEGLDYNMKQVAMEDIDFNKKTEGGGGVLVKCRRFKAGVDRTIKEGGVAVEVRQSSARKTQTKSLELTVFRLGWFKPFHEWKTFTWEWMNEDGFEDNAEFYFYEWITERHRKGEEKSKSLANKMTRIFSDDSLGFTERFEKLLTLLENTEKEEISKETSVPAIFSLPEPGTSTHSPLAREFSPEALRESSSSPRPGPSTDVQPPASTPSEDVDPPISSPSTGSRRPAGPGDKSPKKKKKKEQRKIKVKQSKTIMNFFRKKT